MWVLSEIIVPALKMSRTSTDNLSKVGDLIRLLISTTVVEASDLASLMATLVEVLLDQSTLVEATLSLKILLVLMLVVSTHLSNDLETLLNSRSRIYLSSMEIAKNLKTSVIKWPTSSLETQPTLTLSAKKRLSPTSSVASRVHPLRTSSTVSACSARVKTPLRILSTSFNIFTTSTLSTTSIPSIFVNIEICVKATVSSSKSSIATLSASLDS